MHRNIQFKQTMSCFFFCFVFLLFTGKQLLVNILQRGWEGGKVRVGVRKRGEEVRGAQR